MERTNRALKVNIAQAAGEQKASLHAGLVGVPDAHAVVCNHSTHGMVSRFIPFLFRQLQQLLQLLTQMPVCLCQK